MGETSKKVKFYEFQRFYYYYYLSLFTRGNLSGVCFSEGRAHYYKLL